MSLLKRSNMYWPINMPSSLKCSNMYWSINMSSRIGSNMHLLHQYATKFNMIYNTYWNSYRIVQGRYENLYSSHLWEHSESLYPFWDSFWKERLLWIYSCGPCRKLPTCAPLSHEPTTKCRSRSTCARYTVFFPDWLIHHTLVLQATLPGTWSQEPLYSLWYIVYSLAYERRLFTRTRRPLLHPVESSLPTCTRGQVL